MRQAGNTSFSLFVGLSLFLAVFAPTGGSRCFVPAALAAEDSVVSGVDSTIDTDDDSLTDWQEINVYHTDPINPDTDSDGYADGHEVKNGYSPRDGGNKRLNEVDADKDYLNDAMEIAAGTDLLNPDSDGDLYLDGTEVAAGYDPLNPAPLKLAKRIEVSLADQTLSYYFGDRLFGAFKISSGVKKMPTPTGEFEISDKMPVKHYGGRSFDYPNTKWNLLFTRKNGWGYYIHGAYWHDNFGQPMSHGCVNVSYKDMESLYWWAQVGTPLSIKK